MPDVVIVGLKELGDTLDLLGQNVQKVAVRNAIKPAAEVFRREVRANAPVREEGGPKGKKQREPGYLKKHIGRWIRANTSDGSLTASVGPTPSAFYGRFQEFGTVHQPARPWMRPAFDSKKDEATKVFSDTLMVEIDKALPK